MLAWRCMTWASCMPVGLLYPHLRAAISSDHDGRTAGSCLASGVGSSSHRQARGDVGGGDGSGRLGLCYVHGIDSSGGLKTAHSQAYTMCAFLCSITAPVGAMPFKLTYAYLGCTGVNCLYIHMALWKGHHHLQAMSPCVCCSSNAHILIKMQAPTCARVR